jgi:hypothetical protein
MAVFRPKTRAHATASSRNHKEVSNPRQVKISKKLSDKAILSIMAVVVPTILARSRLALIKNNKVPSLGLLNRQTATTQLEHNHQCSPHSLHMVQNEKKKINLAAISNSNLL